MAIHFYARLETRFIPILLLMAALLSLAPSLTARAAGSPAGQGSAEIGREELRALVRESHPARLDRRPGLSAVSYADDSEDGVRVRIEIAAQLPGAESAAAAVANGEEPALDGAGSSESDPVNAGD